MSKHILHWRITASLVAALSVACVLPAAASARQIWNGGRNIHPKTPPCALEKAVAHHALLAWDTCMGGQINPPAMGGNAAAYYWVRRRKCEPKYRLFTKDQHRYQACEAGLKARRR